MIYPGRLKLGYSSSLEEAKVVVVFKLREAVVGEYRDYVESCIRVLDPRIDAFEQVA